MPDSLYLNNLTWQYPLERIDNGTYGECDDCGEEIGQARLEAIPEATRCVD
jgi:DnaK suppressor protein